MAIIWAREFQERPRQFWVIFGMVRATSPSRKAQSFHRDSRQTPLWFLSQQTVWVAADGRNPTPVGMNKYKIVNTGINRLPAGANWTFVHPPY